MNTRNETIKQTIANCLDEVILVARLDRETHDRVARELFELVEVATSIERTKAKAVGDIARQIIEAIMSDDAEERTWEVEDDYMLKSNLDTFESFTGHKLYERSEDKDDADA